MLDGLFFYLRRDTVDKEPVIFALGIKESGEYEILGFYLTVKESHNNYSDVLEDLYKRGLKEPLLFIADGINNLDEEVMRIYPKSDFQLCTIQYMKGLKSKVKEKRNAMRGLNKCSARGIFYKYTEYCSLLFPKFQVI